MNPCGSILPKEQRRKPNHTKNKDRHIEETSPDSGDVLSFSFRYFWDKDLRFASLCDCEVEFYTALLEKIRYYSAMSRDQFVRSDHKERRHPLYWEELNVDNFPYDPADMGDIYTDSAWQFCLHSKHDKEQKWRIHGFLYNSTFYVVWFDRTHFLKNPREANHKKR